MIPLTRARDESIHNQFIGSRLIAASLRLVKEEKKRRNGSIEKHEFDSKIWGRAKDQLLVESNDKCAYCETPTAVNDFGDVEHYRPKSLYWWLAYCLDNYLVSCAICNQKFKSNKFPKLARKLRAPSVPKNASDAKMDSLAEKLVPDPLDTAAVDAFLEKHDSEVPLLVNPYIDDPADYFAWHADMTIQEVDLIPGTGSELAEECVNAAKAVYGLDRSRLRRNRFHTFASYIDIKLTLEEPGLSAPGRTRLENSIARMALDEHPYAGMIRFYEDNGSPSDWIRDGFLTV